MLEGFLETLLATDSSVLGEDLLVIGRQESTVYGTRVDLLALDALGELHVIELKKDKTAREVVAQTLDYATWAESLRVQHLRDILQRYQLKYHKPELTLEDTFSARFGSDLPEETGGRSLHLTVVAAEVDAATARIVEFLSRYQVPLNVALFRYFDDDGRQYIARTWLVDEEVLPPPPLPTKWDGRSWYVVFAEEDGQRSWQDASRYGFVSASGGPKYTGVLRKIPIDSRVFVLLSGGHGYIGIGEVDQEAMPFSKAVIRRDGQE
jgi:hypothetical protein